MCLARDPTIPSRCPAVGTGRWRQLRAGFHPSLCMGAKSPLPSPTPARAVTGRWASSLARGPISSPLSPLSTVVELAHFLSFPKSSPSASWPESAGDCSRAYLPPSLVHRALGAPPTTDPLSFSRGSFPAPAKYRDPLLPTLPNSMGKDVFSPFFSPSSQSKS